MPRFASDGSEPSIVIEGLAKSFGALEAVHPLTLSIGQGELFGLIGPDGAGKTTLLRMLTTLLLPTAGGARVEGLDVVRDYRALRRILGYMPGRFSLYQDLTVRENLEFFASVFATTVEEGYGLIRDIYGQIERFEGRRAGKLSGGMKQKLALSCALIHRPRVLFLDEPTTGVDPVSRREFWEMLQRLRAQGLTIMVSTPYMDEAARCGRIALMQSGQILQVDSPEGIRVSYPYTLWAVRSERMIPLLTDLRQSPEVETAYSFGESYHITLRASSRGIEALRTSLLRAGHTSVSIVEISPSVEDCFMALLPGVS